MPVETESALPASGGSFPRSRSHSHSHRTSHSRANDEDAVVGLGVPHGSDDGDDGDEEARRQEEYMDEIIMKHRSELQSFVARAMDVNVSGASKDGPDDARFRQENLQNIPPSADQAADTPPRFDPNFRTPQPKRNKTSERLLQLSRTERTDRMRLAELSDVRNEKLGREAILRWNPHAKRAEDFDNRAFGTEGARRNGTPMTRGRSMTSPPHTTARMLGEFSKDYVQQAIDFTNHDLLTDDDDDDDRGAEEEEEEEDDDDDDDDLDLEPPLQTDLDDIVVRQLRGPLSAKKMRKYVKHVKHMEMTIAQLVQQKEELIRNQAEFDKHASGMFPTLENLNDQLSQLVQDRLLQSQVNMKDDLEGELRGFRVRLNELEADARQRRNDAELQEQKNQIDLAQVKTEVASLGTTGSLQNHKMELLTSQIKQLQQEIHQSVEVSKSLSNQYQVIDNRITTIQVSLKDARSQSSSPQKATRGYVGWALLILILAVLAAMLTADRCSWWFGRCRPLT